MCITKQSYPTKVFPGYKIQIIHKNSQMNFQFSNNNFKIIKTKNKNYITQKTTIKNNEFFVIVSTLLGVILYSLRDDYFYNSHSYIVKNNFFIFKHIFDNFVICIKFCSLYKIQY